MKKLFSVLVIIIFVINAFCPVIYGVEEVIENKIEEDSSEVNIVDSDKISEVDEKEDENISNEVIENEEVAENNIEENLLLEVQAENDNYTGQMWIDSPINYSNFSIPDIEYVQLSGWAVSNDEKSVVKLYVNNVCWGEVSRLYDRPDVKQAIPMYAGTTDKPGFSYGINISAFPEGLHSIRVEQVSRYGKIISQASVIINVQQKEYTGQMWIDSPINYSSYSIPNTEYVQLSGWAVSDDEKSVVKLYVNDVCWGEISRLYDRPDVKQAIPNYAKTTDKPGFSYGINISAFPEGLHNIRVEQVSRYGKIISQASVIINVSTPDYPSNMYIDTPIRNAKYHSGMLAISGWAVTTAPNDYISVYLDGVYQTDVARVQRNDVIDAFGQEYGLNYSYNSGIYSEINTANLGEGTHTVKLIHYSGFKKKINETEVKFMISNTLKNGIDVSNHNKTIDWYTVKKQGIDFAILKIGEYRESSGRILIDAKFNENYSQCKRYGIAVGGYFYSYAFNSEEACHEADACLKIISGKSFEMPIYFDLEDPIVTRAVGNGTTNVDNLTNATITFCNKMNENGYQSGVYSYRNFLYNYLHMDRLENYNVWLAHYVSSTDYKGKFDMWQYTSSGSVAGINGSVDLNYCYRNY